MNVRGKFCRKTSRKSTISGKFRTHLTTYYPRAAEKGDFSIWNFWVISVIFFWLGQKLEKIFLEAQNLTTHDFKFGPSTTRTIQIVKIVGQHKNSCHLWRNSAPWHNVTALGNLTIEPAAMVVFLNFRFFFLNGGSKLCQISSTLSFARGPNRRLGQTTERHI